MKPLAVLALALLLVPAAACAGKLTDAEREVAARWQRADEHRRAILRGVDDETTALDALLLAHGAVGLDTDRATPEAAEARSARLLARMLDLHPDEAVVRHRVAAFCRGHADRPGRPCEGYDAIRAYADADPRNAWPWLMWAGRAAERGDLVDAWWAMDRAAQAERATLHWSATVAAAREFLARTSAPELGERDFDRAVAALTYAMVAPLPSLEDAVALCGDRSVGVLTAGQRGTCWRVGTLLAAAPTMLESHIGARMLARHARTAAERRAAKAAELDFEAAQSAHQLLPDDIYAPTADAQRAYIDYVADVAEHGEMESSRQLVQRSGYTWPAWRAAVAKAPALRSLFERPAEERPRVQ